MPSACESPVSFPGYLVLLGKGMARARRAEALMQM